MPHPFSVLCKAGRAPWPEVKTETAGKEQAGSDASFFWARFRRQGAIRFAGVSAVILIPLYWHQRIEAGDLGSHLYNAWLAQLIRQGKAPGLWIARQWNNVLFDLLLSWLGSAFGLWAAERIAVSLTVLTFFWGAFALIGAVTRRPPWKLCPLLAVFTYGWTFEMGFMNYYISLGLCFFALALFWRGWNGARLIALALVPLIWMAHPLGVICFGGLAFYAGLAKFVRARYHKFLLLAAGVCLLDFRMFLARHYAVKWNAWARYFFFNGADQLALYSARYYLLYALFAALLVVAVAVDASGRRREGGFWDACGIPLQLYLVAGTASLLLPSIVALPQYNEPLSYLTARLSSVSGILACWMLGAVKPRKWHTIGYAVIASVFFIFLYVDTGTLNKMEEQVERSVAALPAGHRVVGDIDSGASRVVTEHIVDRACIGRCFSYENYEPGTGQFRVRATPGNSIVDASEVGDIDDQTAEEVAKSLDRPVYEISQCDGSTVNICVHELTEDEVGELVRGKFEN